MLDVRRLLFSVLLVVVVLPFFVRCYCLWLLFFVCVVCCGLLCVVWLFVLSCVGVFLVVV